MVFAPDNRDSYVAAKDSDYKCFIFDTSVDVDAFVNAVRSGGGRLWQL